MGDKEKPEQPDTCSTAAFLRVPSTPAHLLAKRPRLRGVNTNKAKGSGVRTVWSKHSAYHLKIVGRLRGALQESMRKSCRQGPLTHSSSRMGRFGFCVGEGVRERRGGGQGERRNWESVEGGYGIRGKGGMREGGAEERVRG